MNNLNFAQYLQPTEIIDSQHPHIRAYTRTITKHTQNQPLDLAVAIYYAVRDGIRYNPYKFDLSVDGLKASATIEAGEGWCVPKAALLAACCRAKGIPTQLGYADVRKSTIVFLAACLTV